MNRSPLVTLAMISLCLLVTASPGKVRSRNPYCDLEYNVDDLKDMLGNLMSMDASSHDSVRIITGIVECKMNDLKRKLCHTTNDVRTLLRRPWTE